MLRLVKALRTFALVTFFVATSANAHQGPGSGNGGKGVLIDGKPYLLDLVEGGVERSPYFDSKTQADPELLSAVQKIFADIPLIPTELVARKLSEVSKTRYVFALLMLRTMGLFQWRLVNLPPSPVEDQRQGVSVGISQEFQLAKRLERSIIIDQSMAKQMDPENLAALIFHETAYAFARPLSDGKGSFFQDVGAIQEFTAFLFTPPTSEQLNNMILMMQRIYPDGIFAGPGYGGIVKDDSLNRIKVNPYILFKLSKNTLDTKPKAIVILEEDISEAVFSHEDFYLAWSQQEICKKIPSGNWALSYEVIQPYRQFDIDFYQGANDESYSYVKISTFKGRDQSFAKPIAKDTCKNVVAEVYENARSVFQGFHKN